MTGDLRRRLREAVDAARRQRVVIPSDTQERWREAQRRRRARIRSGELVVTKHSRTGYMNGCRCDVCSEAQAAYMRVRYAKRVAERGR